MEAYPAELTSPPVPLVALCGKAELVRGLADYLRTQHVPRLHSIGVEDAHSVAGAFGARKAAPAGVPPAPPAGILKSGWLRKHRTSSPAAAAVLVERDAVVGDPSSWAWLVSQLDAVKAAVKSRGARVVVLVVMPPGAGEVPEDRLAMLCRQAGADRRCVLTYSPSEGLPALQAVGRILHEQAAAFYSADAQRRLAQHAHRNAPSVDLNLRTAFKLGALAEFRADWSTSLRMYSEAYGYLPQLLSAAGGAQPQRFVEIRAVAEHVHVKVVSLLLLALKQLPEALAQFDTHMRLFRKLPFQAPPGLIASHHAWLCRQHMVMAELLMSCGSDLSALKREHQPGQLYLAAAKSAIERRKVAGFISGMHGGKAPAPPGRVEPGLYVGQLLLLPADPAAAAVAAGTAAVAASLAGLPVSAAKAAAGAGKRLSNEQFELALEVEEARLDHSRATVDLLHTAQDALKRSGRRANKTLQHAMLLLGHELLEAGDVPGAERLLTEVAGFYRRDRWEGPLATALLLLRECRQHTHDVRAHTELSLEVSALEGSSLDAEQRAAMGTAAVAALVPEPPLLELQPTDAPSAGSGGQLGMHYSVTSLESGWLTVLPLCAGFFDPMGSTTGAGGSSSSGSAGSVLFGAAFWNNSPVDLPLASAEVQLSDGVGTFTAQLLPADGSGRPEAQPAAGPAADLVLPPGRWQRLAASVPVRCSGELQALAVVLSFGGASVGGGTGTGSSSITFRLPALLPSVEQVPASPSRRLSSAGVAVAPQAPVTTAGWLRGGWSASRLPFSATEGFLAGRCSTEVPPQHSPPLLLLQAPEVLLQGEQAALTVTVVAAGDGIREAVLRGRALHVDSQQHLGLVPVPGSSAVPAVGAGGEAQSDAERQVGDLGGCSVALGELAAGQQRQVTLLLDARYRGSVEVAADVLYTAASPSRSSGGKPESGHCTSALSVQVQLPWKLGVQLLAPPATHTLLAAAPAAQHSTDGEGGGDAALLEQQRRLQGLSMQDSAASAVGDLGPSDSRDLPVMLLRSLPSKLVLPAGQQCSVVVQLQSLAMCQLDVVAVELEAAAGAVAVAAEGSQDAGSGEAAAADTLNKSDVFTAVFSVASSSSQAAELPSLGFLRLRWRRHQRRPPALVAATRGGSHLAPAAAQAALADLGGSDGSAGAAAAPASSAGTAPSCEVLVPLPAVSFMQPLLTASMRFPPSASAGSPVTLQLLLSNSGPTSQELAVAVGDPHGFLLAGPKSTTVQLLPHSQSTVGWQAVPYHTGLLRLPEISASSVQHGQQVEVTRGCSLFVERPAEQLDTAAQHLAAVPAGLI